MQPLRKIGQVRSVKLAEIGCKNIWSMKVGVHQLTQNAIQHAACKQTLYSVCMIALIFVQKWNDANAYLRPVVNVIKLFLEEIQIFQISPLAETARIGHFGSIDFMSILVQIGVLLCLRIKRDEMPCFWDNITDTFEDTVIPVIQLR